MLIKNLGLFIIGFIIIIGVGIVIGLQIVAVDTQQSRTLFVSELTKQLANTIETVEATPPDSDSSSNPQVVVTTEPPPAVTPEPAHAFGPSDEASSDSSSTQQLLQVPNVIVMSSDVLILNIVANSPFVIGVVEYASIADDIAPVRALPLLLADGSHVDVVLNGAINGMYPISNVYYLYSTEHAIQQKPQIAAFIACYLNRINKVVGEAGYRAAHQDVFAETLRSYNGFVGNPPTNAVPDCQDAGLNQDAINISVSEAAAPLTRQMADLFRQDGFAGNIDLNMLTTIAGFEAFCTMADYDILAADRPLYTTELLRCLDADRTPLAFAIGESPIVLVVSKQNTFVKDLALTQVRKIFMEAQTWSEIDPNWPAEPIVRILPSEANGTLKAFVSKIFEEEGDSFAIVRNVVESVGDESPQATTGSQPTTVAGASAIEVLAMPNMAAATSTALPTVTSVPTPELALTPTDSPTATPTATEAPTATSEPTRTATTIPTAVPTASPTSTHTPLPPVDYVFGYLEERPWCIQVTDIVMSYLTEQGWTVRKIALPNIESLLAQSGLGTDEPGAVDLSLCYIDPDDREPMMAHSGVIGLLATDYAQIDDVRYSIIATYSRRSELRSKQPCLFNFFRLLKFDSLETGQTANEWLQKNRPIIDSWGSCGPN